MKPLQVVPVLLILLLALVGPAAALGNVINSYAVNQYSVATNPGTVIYQIIVDPVPMGTHQVHTLNYNGAQFLLEISSAQSYVVYHDFWVNLTMPNGSVDARHVAGIGKPLAGTYKTTIQPVYFSAQSLHLFPAFSVDLNIGLNPVTVGFDAPAAEWQPETAIPFSSASGNLGAETNVFVWTMTKQEFQDNVVQYNPLFGLQTLGATVFQWSWQGVLGLLYQIPYFGPTFVSLIDILIIVIGGLLFWIVFIVLNLPAFIAGGEVLILILSVVLVKGKLTPQRVAKNIYNYNVSAIIGFLGVLDLVYDWISRFLSRVSDFISNLKPGG